MSGAEKTYGTRSAKPQTKNLDNPDETLAFPKGVASNVRLGDLVVGRLVQQPGWRWSEQVKQIAGTESCQFHHIGVGLSGSAMIRMDDGTEMAIGPGDVFDIPPGHDQWVTGDEPAVSIIWGGWRGFGKPPVGDRILTTMLMTDITGSTDRAAQMGDAAWDQTAGAAQRAGARGDRAVPRAGDRHHRRRLPDRLRRRRDGRCRRPRTSARAVGGIGLEIHAGIHTGEVELVPGNIRGLAVHETARIMALAGAGEILVSSTTKELVSASGVTFEDRGRHVLKGVPGERQVYAAILGV